MSVSARLDLDVAEERQPQRAPAMPLMDVAAVLIVVKDKTECMVHKHCRNAKIGRENGP